MSRLIFSVCSWWHISCQTNSLCNQLATQPLVLKPLKWSANISCRNGRGATMCCARQILAYESLILQYHYILSLQMQRVADSFASMTPALRLTIQLIQWREMACYCARVCLGCFSLPKCHCCLLKIQDIFWSYPNVTTTDAAGAFQSGPTARKDQLAFQDIYDPHPAGTGSHWHVCTAALQHSLHGQFVDVHQQAVTAKLLLVCKVFLNVFLLFWVS